MTVRELRQKLSYYPSHLQVVIEYDSGFYKVSEVSSKTILEKNSSYSTKDCESSMVVEIIHDEYM